MVEEPREPVRERLVRLERRPLEHATRAEGARERVEVALDRVLPVDDRLAAVERAPEVVHVPGVRPALLAEEQRPWLRSDEHRDGARPLRRLSR